MARGAARKSGTEDEPKYIPVVVRLTPDLNDALRSRAEEEDRPLAWLIRKALEQFLAEDQLAARP